MTEAEQIVGFLQKKKPKAYCDDYGVSASSESLPHLD